MQASVPVATYQSSIPNWQGLVPAPVSGSTSPAQGLTSLTLTGMNLPQNPSTVIFWLQQTGGDPFVVATPSGTPTTDGFTVNFAVPLPSANYVLVWLIYFN